MTSAPAKAPRLSPCSNPLFCLQVPQTQTLRPAFPASRIDQFRMTEYAVISISIVKSDKQICAFPISANLARRLRKCVKQKLNPNHGSQF